MNKNENPKGGKGNVISIIKYGKPNIFRYDLLHMRQVLSKAFLHYFVFCWHTICCNVCSMILKSCTKFFQPPCNSNTSTNLLRSNCSIPEGTERIRADRFQKFSPYLFR